MLEKNITASVMRSRYLISNTNQSTFWVVWIHNLRIKNLTKTNLGYSQSIVKHPPAPCWRDITRVIGCCQVNGREDVTLPWLQSCYDKSTRERSWMGTNSVNLLLHIMVEESSYFCHYQNSLKVCTPRLIFTRQYLKMIRAVACSSCMLKP